MAAIHSDEFKRDAVRIAQTSGLTRRQVASDLGIGHSTLGDQQAWPPTPIDEAQAQAGLDLSRFRSGLLRAILAIKETGYGSDTQ